ncbi:ribonuclease P [Candidatus Woesearchaeota archaeon]|jgi:ribonuclease P protein subunit RPR2|nr:ribonuclease P [Candidatus Woesearchaeota archaeon]
MDNKEIARERIKKLFSEADEVFSKDKKLANRYINLARKIAMKFNLRMPRGYKRKFCKHCYSYLKPGKNLRVRTKGKNVVYYCLECKKFMKFPLSKKGK